MRKVIGFLLVLAMCVGTFAACGNSVQEETEIEPSKSAESMNTEPVTTEPPVETEPVAAHTVLDQTQLQGKCTIGDGNAYLLRINNPAGMAMEGWSAALDVGADFDIDSITYLNGYAETMEEKDVAVECRLEEGQLILVPAGWKYEEDAMALVDEPAAEKNENAIIFPGQSLYLLLASDQLSEEMTFSTKLYTFDSSDNLREQAPGEGNLKKATGEVVLRRCLSTFSEGLCWAEIEYVDTGDYRTAIIDKDGTVLAELRPDAFDTYGDFYNGVSLISTRMGVYQYINAQGEVVFSSDDPEYGSLICGMFDGGYMFVRKTESSMTANTNYYAVINCNREFVIEWLEYDGYDMFNYFGGGVFMFLNGYSERKSVSCFWYNAETETWGHINADEDGWEGINAASLLEQPDLVAEESDGWLLIDTENRASRELIAISTRDGTAYKWAWSDASVGLYGDGAYVLADGSGLSYFDTATGETVKLDYEYAELVTRPEDLIFDVRRGSFAEVGYWPAVNMPEVVKVSQAMETVPTVSRLCDLRYSEGAMLLQLQGKDGIAYYTLIDKQGNTIVEPVPGEAIGTLGNGRFVVQVEGVYHILNEKGEEVFTELVAEDSDYFAIDTIQEFHDGLAYAEMICKDGSNATVLLDVDGNVVFRIGKTVVKAVTEVGE